MSQPETPERYLNPEPKNPKDYFKGDLWDLPTDIELVEPGMAEIENRLRKAGWETELGPLSGAIREGWTNAIIHANLEVPKPETGPIAFSTILARQQELQIPKKVRIGLDIKPELIKITIQDEGAGFNPEDVPSPIEDEKAVRRATGRGLFMMRVAFETVKYDQGQKQLTLIKTRRA